jgi:hypothetical protein
MEKSPNTQLFLNLLKAEEVRMFRSEIYASARYCRLINHRHMFPPIDLTELATMKSTRPQDGE